MSIRQESQPELVAREEARLASLEREIVEIRTRLRSKR